MSETPTPPPFEEEAVDVPDPDAALRGRDLPALFRLWEDKQSTPGYDPVPILTRLFELLEEATEIYMQKDPDPFDERHPSRTDPDCELGRMLKLLFRKDHFMTRLVSDYLRDNFFTRQNIQRSSLELNIAACRLILVIMPGLESSAVFQGEFDHLTHRLYNWAEHSEEPLSSYATGLLAAAMEVQDIAVGFREQNGRLISVMLKRLHSLQSNDKQGPSTVRTTPTKNNIVVPMDMSSPAKSSAAPVVSARPFAHLGDGSSSSSPELRSPQLNEIPKFNLSTLFKTDTNQSMENIYICNRIPIYPTTSETYQMLILRYLTSLGEYQEFLGQVFEHNAMLLIFRYIENLEQRDTCLAFEALKYLASLLCHKKFSLEFITHGGLLRLMKVPRPSIAATGVSIALYYLAYCEDVMERICSMSPELVPEVVSYALWLLGCSHDSGRCHATMFFGLSFQFRVVLYEFDSQDGLRKLYNVISILQILGADDYTLNDDEECAERQLVRHVCVAMKKYMESHLFYRYSLANRIPSSLTFRTSKCTPEMISDQVRTLQEVMPFRARWEPVENVLTLNIIPLLLRIIACSYEWNYSMKAETVRSALDVLIVCCVIPRAHLVFCDRISLPDAAAAAGTNIILGAAEGEIVADAEVQKAALAVLVHCVCSPILKSLSVDPYVSARKSKGSEELLAKLCESVQSNNGIIVLLQLMEIKTPITDADCIRGMACRALAGLARSETIRQIIGKLPLFTNGQLQSLMRDPILQEKRTEHVQFQKYALELMERVSGKPKAANNHLDASLANIHKANVVAQTKIQFNEQQLYELIHEHLQARGFVETASTLRKEAGLRPKMTPLKPIYHHSPFSFRSPSTGLVSRSRVRTRFLNFNATLHTVDPPNGSTLISNGSVPPVSQAPEEIPAQSSCPIKLIKKNHTTTSPIPATPNLPQRSLQKQISAADTFISTTVARKVAQQNGNLQTAAKTHGTLDTIITEYLANQHALCANPMTTCPQFDLFKPHKCPDPRPNQVSGLSHNFAGRYFRSQGGFSSQRLDRRLVHSQFCIARTLRTKLDSDCFFTCCDFTPCTSSIVIGSYNGEVKVFNINESGEEFSFGCHDSYVNSIKCNRAGNLIITSCSMRAPLSALWNIENKQFTNKLQWDEEEYMEFSNLSQDRLLGTKAKMATIYDLGTGTKISSFSPTISNEYTMNRATFCPNDELILSDGVLWDVRSGKELHKFDKLNQALSGVFHPNGLEVLSNTEVWDLRTFHLLRTVPSLDQCQVTFSPQNVIYGIFSSEFDQSMALGGGRNYESSFKTLDSYDFSSIATVDVKRNIYNLSVNKYGSQIGIVENLGEYDIQESVVRIYGVGRKKNVEDEAEDDDNLDLNDDTSESDIEPVVFRGERQRLRRRMGFLNDDGDDAEWIPASSSSSDNDDEYYAFDDDISGGGGDNETDDGMWFTDSDNYD